VFNDTFEHWSYSLVVFTPLAARGIVMAMTDGRAVVQDLSMQYFSPYYAAPLKISTLVSCGLVVVHDMIGLGIK